MGPIQLGNRPIIIEVNCNERKNTGGIITNLHVVLFMS